jgi:hypothetical protein
VLLAFVLAVALVGCGGGSKASPDEISRAAAKTSHVGSIKADFTVSGPGAKTKGSGVFNNKDRSGKLSMELQVNRRTSKLETIVTGNVLYMRSRVFAQAGLSGAREWVKLDLAQLARQRGVDLSTLVNASPTPSSVLGYLGGSSTAKKIGDESIRGVKTTHYRVMADLQRAAAHARGSTRASIRRVIQVSGLKRLPVDAWIDGNGYLRKVSWAEHTSPQQAAKVTMVLHDFGSPVTIEPPAGRVVDLLARLSGG